MEEMAVQGISRGSIDGGITPLQRESFQQQIYKRLRNPLIAGSFFPGEAVSSRGLAQALDVSAMPVREALTRLTAEGALELTNSRTLRVRVLTPDDFDEATAIRLDLEAMAAIRAAGQATGEDAAAVRRLHRDLIAAAESVDADRYLSANAAFHSGIYTAAGWPLLLGMIQRLWLIVGPSIRSSVPDRQHMATSMQFHNAAAEAMEARDATTLRSAVVDDIRTAAINIRASLADEAGETT